MNKYVNLIRFLPIFILVLSSQFVIADDNNAEKKAICATCDLFNGQETKASPVHCISKYEGDSYSFCSAECKQLFDDDPIGYIPPNLPIKAPSFILPDVDGDTVSLNSFKGKYVLLEFWATWCNVCKDEMPSVQELQTTLGDDQFTVLSISLDKGRTPEGTVKKYLNKNRYNFPVLIDCDKTPTWEKFHIKALPAKFLVDPSGQIVAQWLGVYDISNIKSTIKTYTQK